MDWKIKIVDVGYKNNLDIYIYYKKFNKIGLLNGDTVTEYEEGEPMPNVPTLSLPSEALQEFANALNKMGIAPEKEFIAGKLEATEKHLQDMRTLLKIK